MAPDNQKIFPAEEEIEFIWEAGEGGTPSVYRWEAEYTDPVGGLRFGYWQNDNRRYFSDEMDADVTSKTMGPVNRNAGRWRVKALNQAGESDWSEWSYFGYGEPVPFVNESLSTWRYVTCHCFTLVEAGDIINMDVGIWTKQDNTATWYVQLIDPDGNIERSWKSGFDGANVLYYGPSAQKAEHQVLKSGIYSVRVINVISTSELRVSIRVNPLEMDEAYSWRGNTNPGWHIIK